MKKLKVFGLNFFLLIILLIYNYSNPIQAFSNSVYVLITPEFFKSISVYFNEITVFSNNGIIFDSTKEYKASKYEKANYDVFGVDGNTNLVDFLIISSFNEEKYYRSYIKIQNVCATVGGILNGMLIFGSFFLTFFPNKGYKIELINSLFSFEVKEQSTQIEKDENTKTPILTDNFILTKLSNKIKTQNTIDQKKLIPFNLSIVDYICIKNRCCYNKRVDHFQNDIDEIKK